MKFHPLSDLFPLMEGREFDELVVDIQSNGLREPIWLHEGQILDGRNRWRACAAAGVQEPAARNYSGTDPLGFVLSLNLHRRHLNESQRAMVAARIATLPAHRPSGSVGIPTVMTQPNAAARLNVSRDSVIQARKVIDQATPEIVALVDRGELAVNMAAKLASASPEFQRAVVQTIESGEASKPLDAIRQVRAEMIRERSIQFPSGKYRVIYADPPWSYSNNMPDNFTEQRDHYPVMALADICALPVRDVVEDDAVLFLWVTSPILEEAFEVVNAWGFNYKASFVWDKMRPVMGHYNSVSHELLLVCTRGACMPDVIKLFDSVVSEPKSEHSRKPEIFYEIIETLYPYGTRVELFSRGATRAGWAAYGNQADAAA